jgi:hypothetical protein
MAAATATATDPIKDVLISSIKQGQELAISGITAWSELASKAISSPPLTSMPFDSDPSALVDAGFGIAGELLTMQKDLALKFVEVVKPKAG